VVVRLAEPGAAALGVVAARGDHPLRGAVAGAPQGLADRRRGAHRGACELHVVLDAHLLGERPACRVAHRGRGEVAARQLAVQDGRGEAVGQRVLERAHRGVRPVEEWLDVLVDPHREQVGLDHHLLHVYHARLVEPLVQRHPALHGRADPGGGREELERDRVRVPALAEAGNDLVRQRDLSAERRQEPGGMLEDLAAAAHSSGRRVARVEAHAHAGRGRQHLGVAAQEGGAQHPWRHRHGDPERVDPPIHVSRLGTQPRGGGAGHVRMGGALAAERPERRGRPHPGRALSRRDDRGEQRAPVELERARVGERDVDRAVPHVGGVEGLVEVEAHAQRRHDVGRLLGVVLQRRPEGACDRGAERMPEAGTCRGELRQDEAPPDRRDTRRHVFERQIRRPGGQPLVEGHWTAAPVLSIHPQAS
jgi:hypothetical protein